MQHIYRRCIVLIHKDLHNTSTEGKVMTPWPSLTPCSYVNIVHRDVPVCRKKADNKCREVVHMTQSFKTSYRLASPWKTATFQHDPTPYFLYKVLHGFNSDVCTITGITAGMKGSGWMCVLCQTQVQVVSGCQSHPSGPLSCCLPLVCVTLPFCGTPHLTLCPCICVGVFSFTSFMCHTSCLNLYVQLSHSHSLSHTHTHWHSYSTNTHTHSGQGLWMGEPTGRLLCRLSSAVSVSSAFEVDTDSWMLEELCAPLAEEKTQRNINGVRLDMVMQAHTHTHTRVL